MRLVPTILVLVLLCLIPAGCGAARPETGGPDTLRVVTYNLHHGAGLDGRIDVERLAAALRGADVAVLQEVDRGVPRSGGIDLLAALAERAGLPHVAFGKTLDLDGGAYGNGILSRHPIRREAHTTLRRETPGEPRGVLQTVLDVGGRPVAVLATHLDAYDAAERLRSLDQIGAEILPAYAAYPTILAGDFNDTPGSAVYARATALLADAWPRAGAGAGPTFPADAPTERLDYVFHDARLAPVAAVVVPADGSDHRPLAVTLRLPPRR